MDYRVILLVRQMGRRFVVIATNATIVGCIETTTRSRMRGTGCGREPHRWRDDDFVSSDRRRTPPGKPALTAKRGSLALGEDDTVLPTAHRGAEPMSYLAARGESPAAFGGRCIPPGCVAPRSNTPGILTRRALPSGRIARLGATPDFHHGLLRRSAARLHERPQAVARRGSCELRRATIAPPFTLGYPVRDPDHEARQPCASSDAW
jgi:hypothetical protein